MAAPFRHDPAATDGGEIMIDATRHLSHHDDEATGRHDGVVLGAIVCAAIVVALFTLHGMPNLLGDRFNADAITYQSR
jgi:hypothetical protein